MTMEFPLYRKAVDVQGAVLINHHYCVQADGRYVKITLEIIGDDVREIAMVSGRETLSEERLAFYREKTIPTSYKKFQQHLSAFHYWTGYYSRLNSPGNEHLALLHPGLGPGGPHAVEDAA